MPLPEIADDQEVSASSSIFSEVLMLEPHVDTRFGGLEGYIMRTTAGRRIYAFEGVPYAQPPLGFFRFRPSVPIEPWGGMREAKKPGPECLQLSPPKVLRVVGNEGNTNSKPADSFYNDKI
ncbi:Esterase SG1 [Orchesella cincta]|uniref:Esterase SG1 n=1 Tax=Orchesella cincta TaxID=48709 RepID=A0A1D2N8A1_ORCCI|nr:Esterase SG1 [Orchesella cincta]